ncbi:chemotaxis protein chel [Pseudooceanicola sediminis]|uniref:Chemotaxis protein chel n=1 Tax=Pseudooceanicola sediminis TaxID=2211117 RepID=A0A399JCS4_9RHOB|nr:rod-binding protein [Pseudooceanicola sediminis]KAA2315562.1 chemotaxis protein chel [Puniceibacterium sp. HSS470]RII40436.1 chemotaxis protein chel [Pseudooceanicola sediminis]
MTDSLASIPPTPPAPPPRKKELWDAAQKMEAAFLSEMLKSAGLGETPESFGGGTGEDQFASFLREEQAHAMVEAGGIGLAEMLYQSLLEKEK